MIYAIKTPKGLLPTSDDIEGAFVGFLEEDKAEEALEYLQSVGIIGEESTIVEVES